MCLLDQVLVEHCVIRLQRFQCFFFIVPLPDTCNLVVPSPKITYESVTLVRLVKRVSCPDMCLVTPVSKIMRVDLVLGCATLL